jgi:hypothetical protein
MTNRQSRYQTAFAKRRARYGRGEDQFFNKLCRSSCYRILEAMHTSRYFAWSHWRDLVSTKIWPVQAGLTKDNP